MYHYNKPRNRPSVPAKDAQAQLFGPNFSLNAAATSVTERPAGAPVTRHVSIPGKDTSSNAIHQSLTRRVSGPSDVYSVSNDRHATNQKRQYLPAPAFAHDLTNSELKEDRRQIQSAACTTNKNHKTPVYLPGDRVIFAESPSVPGVPIVYRTVDERAANPDRLNLDRRRLSICPILEGEEQLRLLNYQHNMIVRIQHLSSLKRLIFLDLYDNQIEEISGMTSLKSLRVLMLGKNRISKIENLDSLTKLDVLDLHGNKISVIENLSHLSELRVLNLAGNFISLVENLIGMNALAELNLRRNHIKVITDVDNLPNLQRLFLSFNEISWLPYKRTQIMNRQADMRRKMLLMDLNYRKLVATKKVPRMRFLPRSFDDISCLAESPSLTEIALDGNPYAQDNYYKQTILRHMPHLKQLDMKRITSFSLKEEERRIAMVMQRREDDKRKDQSKSAISRDERLLILYHPDVAGMDLTLTGRLNPNSEPKRFSFVNNPDTSTLLEKRRLAINNAKRQWETMQGSLMSRTNKLVKMPELYATHVGSFGNESGPPSRNSPQDGEDPDMILSDRPPSSNSRPTSARSLQNGGLPRQSRRDRPVTNNRQVSRSLSRGSVCRNLVSTPEKETITFNSLTSSGLNDCHLAELDGDKLSLYGSQSLEALERNWGIQAAGAVTTIGFKFIDFEELVKHLHKIRTRFPSVQNLTFDSTNIKSFNQINALSGVRRLESVSITLDGNPVTQLSLWKTYMLFRLAHFNLKKINDVEVTPADIVAAERLFGTLAHVITSEVPQSRLITLLGESRKKQILALTEDKPRKSPEAKLSSEKPGTETIGRAGLQHYGATDLNTDQRIQGRTARKEFSKQYMSDLSKEMTVLDRKTAAFREVWPTILFEMVYNMVLEMSDRQAYTKKCMEEFEKGLGVH